MFDIRTDEAGVVHLVGRCDAAASEAASAVLWHLEAPTILDLSALEYVSSAGIGVIVEAHKRLTARGHALRLTGMTKAVRNVFTLTGLHRILTIE